MEKQALKEPCQSKHGTKIQLSLIDIVLTTMILIHFEGLGRAAAPPVAILIKIDDDDPGIYHWLSVLIRSLSIIDYYTSSGH